MHACHRVQMSQLRGLDRRREGGGKIARLIRLQEPREFSRYSFKLGLDLQAPSCSFLWIDEQDTQNGKKAIYASWRLDLAFARGHARQAYCAIGIFPSSSPSLPSDIARHK